MAKRGQRPAKPAPQVDAYAHPEAESPMRGDAGSEPRFQKRKPPATYRYDSSLSPALDWDGQNSAREQADELLRRILEATSLEEAKAAAERLQALGRPFLNWAGKAERLSFDVPTLPLFIHERLSTKAIIDALFHHRRDQQRTLFDLFGDPQHSLADQALRAYEHMDKWLNRLILGDSLVVMNSLLHWENLGGKVQMIYMDPPYGVKFGSNFQPFVRKRDVSHGDDDDLTREPETVQAYRDTWEQGLHSYLTYLRDRLLLARELLHPSGSVFVQIGTENTHHVRELLDEVFGPENFVAQIAFVKTTGATVVLLPGTADYILWYARDKERVKYRSLYLQKIAGGEGASKYDQVQLADETRRSITSEEKAEPALLPKGARIFRLDNLMSQSMGREKGEGAACWFPVSMQGREFRPHERNRWKTNEDGMSRLLAANRVQPTGNSLSYVRYLDDFPAYPITDVWGDIGGIQSRSDPKAYVVQTATKAVERCLLMTTDPGDLVLDPTCGSGTTAYVAEQWGRRWITIDVSRVPLALARQRLLTATFPWYQLKDDHRGPAGGFVYKRKQNNRGEEVGGIVPHVTLKSIANNEPPAEEVLVDRPEIAAGVTRVTGPFTMEAAIPAAMDMNDAGSLRTPVADAPGSPDAGSPQRMLEVLRKSPILRLDGNRTIALKNVRPPAKTLSLSAEAITTNGEEKPVAFVFGPENGPVGEKLVLGALREAHMKGYTHLYVIGFAIQPAARLLIEQAAAMGLVPATYLQATPDLLMGDLLKNMRSSQIFSVCGLPEVAVKPLKSRAPNGPPRYEVTLLGLDVFDPVTLEVIHRHGDDVPAWFLDSDYDGGCFHIRQAFFPRTGTWDNLKKSLKSAYDEGMWEHLAGVTSAPFEAGDHRRIAVKVIDDRGNELLVVKVLGEPGA